MRRPGVLVGAGVAVCFAVLTGCSSSSSGGSAPTSTPSITPSTTATGVPDVPEAFTLLPCPAGTPETTLAIEGCAEHRIVALDKQIDAATESLYAQLSSTLGRSRLVTSQARWVARRHALCLKASNRYAGGTLAPVAFANCEVRMDRARLVALAALTGASSP